MIVPRYDIFHCNPSFRTFPGFFSSSLFIHSLLIKYTRHIFRPPTYARRSDFRPFGRRHSTAAGAATPAAAPTSAAARAAGGATPAPAPPPLDLRVRVVPSALPGPPLHSRWTAAQQPRPPRSSPVRRAAAPLAAQQPRSLCLLVFPWAGGIGFPVCNSQLQVLQVCQDLMQSL